MDQAQKLEKQCNPDLQEVQKVALTQNLEYLTKITFARVQAQHILNEWSTFDQ